MKGPPGKGEGPRRPKVGAPSPHSSVRTEDSVTRGSDSGKRHDEEALAEAADLALESGRWVRLGEYVLIPDTLAVELLANNPDQSWPKTWALGRDDGRIVHVFRAPAGWLR